MCVRLMDSDDAKQVARLHIEGISRGFISSLGHVFVNALYEAIVEDENSFGFVATDDGDDEVLGFITFSMNLSGLYKTIAFTKGFKFAFILARKMISFRVFKKVWDNIFYPKKMKQMNLPDTELLSVVVSPQGRGQGVARKLTENGFEECRRRGIDKVKVLVAADNEPANKLYLRCGFEFVTQIESHGVESNIYVAKIEISTD